MIIIKRNKDIKKQFEEKHLVYPFLKSNGLYGLKGSSQMDKETEEDSLNILLDYLEERKIIKIDEVELKWNKY